MRTRSIAAAVLAAAALAWSGCGSDDPPETPVACLVPPADYLDALEAAPEPVRLAGDTPISSCLVEEQEPGALASVGDAMVKAATQLNGQAREDGRDDDAPLQLGYLVGAVESAAEQTGGIHQDLRLRLNAAARFVPGDERPLDAEFERAFGEGHAAARADG